MAGIKSSPPDFLAERDDDDGKLCNKVNGEQVGIDVFTNGFHNCKGLRVEKFD